MIQRMPHRAALIPILLGVAGAILMALLTGCAGFKGFNASANCDSNGNNCSANFHQSTQAAPKRTHTATPTPEVTVTQTETETPSAEPTITASPVSVGPCNVYLTRQDMEQLAVSEPARQDLMDCMQIPDAQRPEMDNWLAQNALNDVNNTPVERRHWEEHQLADAYHQYS